MTTLRDTAMRLSMRVSDRLGVGDRLRPDDGPSASALLFHDFFAAGESRVAGLDRLRRQLGWLRDTFTPISLSQFVAGLETGTVEDHTLVVTADDTLLDLLDVVDVFKTFEIPLAVFTCVGWTAAASRGTGDDVVARAASALEWHQHDAVEIPFGDGRTFALSPATKADLIDTLILERDAMAPHLAEFCERAESYADCRPLCTWQDLRDLISAGVEVGAHSVTHIWLSEVSAVRQRFEVDESLRLCETMLGQCHAFAYPFGTRRAHNNVTRTAIESAGYRCAFLTHSEFITPRSNAFALPRITMPDWPVSDVEFRARTTGVGVLKQRLRALSGRSLVVSAATLGANELAQLAAQTAVV